MSPKLDLRTKTDEIRTDLIRNYNRLGKVGAQKPFLHVVRDVEVLLSRNLVFNLSKIKDASGKERIMLQCDANKSTVYLNDEVQWDTTMYKDSNGIPTVRGKPTGAKNFENYQAIRFFQKDADYEESAISALTTQAAPLVPPPQQITSLVVATTPSEPSRPPPLMTQPPPTPDGQLVPASTATAAVTPVATNPMTTGAAKLPGMAGNLINQPCSHE